ncbi:MAG: NF038122 family metalloprotease [candidate division WOR-3 bacterium]|nr:MAG: NF038122 family metalloprotease [candidate division WOR-3 bacterium]
MKHHNLNVTFFVACVAIFLVPELVIAEQPTYLEKDYYFYEPGPVMQGELYIDGSTIELETGSLIYPVIGSDLSQITPEEFRDMAVQAREAFDEAPNKTIVSTDRAGRGLNIIYNCTSVPAEAVAALESVAVFIEGLFDDDVEVSINIGFAPLGPGILGMAQSYYAGNPSYTITRSSLVADMDADDSIQLYLPSDNTIPVRYTYASSTATNEDRVYFLVATYNAVIGSFPSLAAQITFSSNYTWDYDPSNGADGMCFQSVAAHEVGHVLGFVSNADGYSTDIDALDMYRFQNSDGTGNFNPDTWYDFQTTARMVDISGGNDDVNSDMIEIEYRMSDGEPYQASHFSQYNVNAIMQPAIGAGETFYPNFYRAADRNMFDAIGWDYILSFYINTRVAGGGSVEIEPDTPWHDPGTPVELTAIPDSGWIFYQWGNDLTGNTNPATVIMDDDKFITASFLTEFVTLTVTVVGDGTVEVTPNMAQYPRGTVVELLAVPDSGWIFSHWSGNLWGSQNPDTIIMNDHKEVTANFVPDTYVGENNFGRTDPNYFVITPNPSNGPTEMRYSIQDAGYLTQDVSLRIYDATGKMIKEYVDQSSTMAGPSSVIWDGRDLSGRRVPNGVYFVKFAAGDYIQTTKLLLIR